MDRKKYAIKAASAFVKMVKTGGVKVKSAFLFGSYAIGKAHSESDIDVALVSPEFSGFRFDDIGKVSQFIWKSDANLEVHPFSPSDFNRKNLLASEVLEKGIRIA